MRDASGRNEVRLRITSRFVGWLEECKPLQSEIVRHMLVERLALRFGGALPLRELPTAHMELVNLVDVCADLTAGLSHLVEEVRYLDPLAPEGDEMAHLADEWFALLVVFGPERQSVPTDLCWADLRAALETLRLTAEPVLEWRLVCELVRTATSYRWSAPPQRCDTVWTAFTWLVGANAVAGEIPALAFLDCVVGELTDDERAPAIDRWLRGWAGLWQVEDQLDGAPWRLRRADRDPGSPAYLVLQIERNPMAGNEILLSHWRQCGQPVWRPERGADVVVSEAELEPAVDEVVSEMETILGARPGVAVTELILEFVLPLEFLSSPVERYRRRSPLGGPDEPMAIDHPVVLRSLDRHRETRLHLAWRQRWEVLKRRPGTVTTLCSRPNGDGDYFVRLAAELMLNQHIVSFVLSEPLREGNKQAIQEWSVALKHGVPAIVWHREDRADERFRQAVTELCAQGELARLPHRVADLRRAALLGDVPQSDQYAGGSLAVLWDDPERLPESPRPREIRGRGQPDGR